MQVTWQPLYTEASWGAASTGTHTHALQPCKLQVQIIPQRPVAAPGGSLMEQVIYPSPLPQALADVDTHLLAHLLHQVGLAELLQRAQGDWMMSQDWQGACHVTCHSIAQYAGMVAAAKR